MTGDETLDARMLLIDPAQRTVGEGSVAGLPALLGPGDVVVVNDAATLPASLRGETERGETIEVRLVEAPLTERTRAVLFGALDYRTPTERRPPPPKVKEGDTLWLGGVRVTVSHVSALSPRLVELALPADAHARFRAVFAAGRPIQYAYAPEPRALFEVQTAFATRPWAVEMPSAARPLCVETLLGMRRRGAEVLALTHAAGLSATGDAALDAALPLPERYDIPACTAERVRAAQREGRRIVAIGTSVVRALEDSYARHGQVVEGLALAERVLGPETRPAVVSGLLTGIHAPGESHYRLLEAFVDPETLAAALALATAKRYRSHELGESCLVLGGVTPRDDRSRSAAGGPSS
jgi:S-adenosylmethionine:tRNA ribosyltransferase-isomerase